MGSVERMTITLPSDMAGLVKGAVDEGDYASSSEVIREALRDWKMRRELRRRQLEELRAEIDLGLADIDAGRVATFSAARIAALGRKQSAGRAKSALPGQRKQTSPLSGPTSPKKALKPSRRAS